MKDKTRLDPKEGRIAITFFPTFQIANCGMFLTGTGWKIFRAHSRPNDFSSAPWMSRDFWTSSSSGSTFQFNTLEECCKKLLNHNVEHEKELALCAILRMLERFI